MIRIINLQYLYIKEKYIIEIQLKGGLRIQLIVLQLILLILAPIWVLKVIHFFCFPIQSFYSSFSLIPHNPEGDIQSWQDINLFKTVLNVCLFGLFFVQHIIMASLKFKMFISKLWKNFPIFQRIIYNLVSTFLLLFVLQLQQPQNYVVFTIPIYLTFPLFIIGTGFFIEANVRMEQSLLLPYKLKKLMTENRISAQQYNEQKVLSQGITIKGSYSLIRHPMQSGTLLSLIFGNTIFTAEKLIIVTTLIVCIYIGVLMQEKRLSKKYQQYENYMKVVKARFIPFLI